MSGRWYRAYEGTTTDAKLAEVALVVGCSRSVVIATWHAILENAAGVNDGGRVDIPARRIAAVLCEPLTVIEGVMAEFETVGMLENGYVTAWKRRQFESDSSTERSRRHRERKRNGDATLQQRDATPPETETETETENNSHPSDVRSMREKVAQIDGRQIDDWFDEFWSTYPKRDGGNPRKPAAEKFEKLVRKTFHPAAIIAGARAYAEACRRDGRFGTAYVKQATTWLNQHGWQDDYLPVGAPAQPAERKPRAPDVWRKGMIAWLESGQWPFGREPTPDDPQTEAPPEILAEFCVSPGRHWMDCRRDWLAKIGGREEAMRIKAELGMPAERSVVAA